MRYIALWRGINVGKAKRLAMADLKALLAELGATNVSTLLNSGNAVFDMRRTITGEQIRAAVREKLGVDARVLLKTAAEWADIAAANPIPEADNPSRLLVAISEAVAPLPFDGGVEPAPGERFVVTPHAAYLWCGNGILESQAAGLLLAKLGLDCTTRNWATVTKIDALAHPR